MARTDVVWIEKNGYLYPARPGGVLIRGTGHYLSFNAVYGENGYGFRDNNGTLEFKNSQGSWSPFLTNEPVIEPKWGDITGDIQNQNDLIEVFDRKADLVNGEIPSEQIPAEVLDSKADLVGGKIPSEQIPALAVTETYVVQNLQERDAIVVQKGDIAIVLSNSTTYIWDGAKWQEMVTPEDGVRSVNNKSGENVLLKTDDIPEGAKRYFTAERSYDALAEQIAAGAGISISRDDEANQITISNTGGVGDANNQFSGAEVQTSGFTVPNTTNTYLEWDTELFDTTNYHDNTTNPSRLTVPVAGKYLTGVSLEFQDWQVLGDGRLRMQLYKNGAWIREFQDFQIVSDSGESPAVSASTVVDAAPGDYFEIRVRQASGGARTITQNSSFYIARLAGSGPDQLPDLNDVGSVNYTDGNVLRANGSKYVSRKLKMSDLEKGALTYKTAVGDISALGNLAASQTIDASLATGFTGTLDADTTLDVSNLGAGQRVSVTLYYDGTAQRALTVNGAGAPEDGLPDMPENASVAVVLTFWNDGVNTFVAGSRFNVS